MNNAVGLGIQNAVAILMHEQEAPGTSWKLAKMPSRGMLLSISGEGEPFMEEA